VCPSDRSGDEEAESKPVVIVSAVASGPKWLEDPRKKFDGDGALVAYLYAYALFVSREVNAYGRIRRTVLYGIGSEI
jgi:hypothetical protein